MHKIPGVRLLEDNYAELALDVSLNYNLSNLRHLGLFRETAGTFP